MPPALIPADEAERLHALRAYHILDSAPEPEFDAITQMVSELLRVPIALVSFVDSHRQWFKSRVGTDLKGGDRDSAFCAHTILGDHPLIVPDARVDERFRDNPLVLGAPFIRFYAGIPLKSAHGFNLGTLCVICHEPRHLSEHELQILLQFADFVGNALALRLARRQLCENHARLLHAEKMAGIGKIAAGIAHEINTPVHFLGGACEFLSDGFSSISTLLKACMALHETVKGSPDFEERVRAIDALAQEHDLAYLLEQVPVALTQTLDGTSRIAELVDSMNRFSHPPSPTHLPGDLNAAIRATAVISGSAWRRHATLELRLDPVLPLIPCSLGEINQVVLNMIINASHAIEERLAHSPKEPGRIIVRTSHTGDSALISIQDNGSGIPAGILSRIYDPFFTTKPAGKGTGQGLAIAHDIIVNKHSGRIAIDTEIGVGTVFSIHLPMATPAKPRHRFPIESRAHSPEPEQEPQPSCLESKQYGHDFSYT